MKTRAFCFNWIPLFALLASGLLGTQTGLAQSEGQTQGRKIRDPFADVRCRAQPDSLSREESVTPAAIPPQSAGSVMSSDMQWQGLQSGHEFALPSTAHSGGSHATEGTSNPFFAASSGGRTVHNFHQDSVMIDDAYMMEGAPIQSPPFMFFSASAKRNFWGTSDFDAVAGGGCGCDEWKNFCNCGQCGNDLGLDIFRRKPACRTSNCGCNECASGLPRRSWKGLTQPSLGPRM